MVPDTVPWWVALAWPAFTAVVEPPPPVITAPPVLPDGAPLPPADPAPAPSND